MKAIAVSVRLRIYLCVLNIPIVDVTFNEIDGSQKEKVNVENVGNEEAPHQAIKNLAIVEVKPIEIQDEDENIIVHFHHDPTTHHVTSNAHGKASASRYNHD